jgi:hypothetical protein
MERGGVLRNVLPEQDVGISAVKEFVMEDVRSSASSSVARTRATVTRQFAGSRVERQVLVRVFDVVWQVSECPEPGLANLDESPRPACVPTRCAVTSRVTEGVAS